MTRLRWLVLLVVLLATGCSKRAPSAEAEAENARREAFAKAAAADAGASRMLSVGSRPNVVFEEGFSPVMYDPPNDYRNAPFRWMGQRGHVRLKGDGTHDMKLKLTGWLHEKVIRAKAVVTLYVNGQRVADTGAVPNEHWWTEIVIPVGMQRGGAWLDLLITVSAVAFHWSDPPVLNVVVLSALEWTELP